MDAKVRLYVDQPLGEGQAVAVSPEQANYLFAVMRLSPGDGVLLFNGKDGEWLAQVEHAAKRNGILRCISLRLGQTFPPDLWLIFSPIKKERTNFIVEKSVELGVARIMPVQMRFTNSERWRSDKQRAHAIEAAEQCGATYVPQIDEMQTFDSLIRHWPEDRLLFWADEGLARQSGSASVPEEKGLPAAILIGPEGGFAEEEKSRLRAMTSVRPLRLGPRILRAETAVIAALVIRQTTCGDW